MSLRNICRTILLEDVIKFVEEGKEWKVLLVDDMGLKVLSSCCNSIEVLRENIALIEDIFMPREPLQQFEAVYILQPTPQSVDILISDFQPPKCLYICAHVFFLYAVPEEIFGVLCSLPCADYIKTIKEINIAFMPYESQIFSLDDFAALPMLFGENRSAGLEYCETLAEKIATVCCTLEVFPLIRYRRKESACSAILARKVQTKLEQYSRNMPMNIEKQGRLRSQLLIVDRGIDCVSPLLHELTLQAMVYDVLPVAADNTYQVDTGQAGATEEEGRISRDIALDESDLFWVQYRHKHIAQVAEMMTDMVKKYDAENVDKMPINKNHLRRLSKDMRNIIRLRLRRKYSDYRHLVSECLSCYTVKIKELCMVEQDMAMQLVDEDNMKRITETVMNILTSPKFTSYEKIRIILLFMMYKNGLSESILYELTDCAGLSHFERQIILNFENFCPWILKMAPHPFHKLAPTKPRTNEVLYKASRWSPVLKDVIELLVQNDLSEHDYPILLSEARPSQDSSISRKSVSIIQRVATWCKDKLPGEFAYAIIFVIGGATYSEIRSVYEVTKAHSGWQIILGSDFLIRPDMFLESIGNLPVVEFVTDMQ